MTFAATACGSDTEPQTRLAPPAAAATIPHPSETPEAASTPTAEPTPATTPSATASPSPSAITPAPIIESPKTNPTKTSSTTTGVPPGTKLTRHDGDLVVSEKGKTIKGLEVHGSISVRAPDVVIENTRVIGVRELKTGLIASRSTGLVVRNSEIYSAHRNPSTNGVMGSNFVLDRVEIRNVVDQVHIHGAGNVTVKDSWLHSNVHYTNDPNWGGGPSHDDNIQIVNGSNITITGNRLSGAHNAAIMITQDAGAVSNLTISKNRLGNGGCSVNLSPGKGSAIAKLKIQKNGFDANQRVKGCAVIGPRSYRGTLDGNYWIASGALLSLSDGGS